MAEGGDEKNDNPFSFTKFVNTDPGDDEHSPEEKEDGFLPHQELPDVSASASRDRRDGDGRRTSKEERDTNPFSFKKFLQTSTSSGSGAARATHAQGPNPLKTLDLAHDLPDFVQDHYTSTCASESPRTRHRNPVVGDVPLPDFTLDTEGSIPPSLDKGAPLNGPNHEPPGLARPGHVEPGYNENSHSANFGDDNVESDDERGGISERLCQTGGGLCQTGGGLPDFLPDSVTTGAGARPKLGSAGVCQENGMSADDPAQENLLALVNRLQEENNRLRSQLQEAIQQNTECKQTENKNVSQSQDSEDVVALELLVQNVEANLQTTTQRALKAETIVACLRKDLAHLQPQLQRLQTENEVLRGGGPDPLRDKAQMVSAQLRTAADTAEQHLRQLLAGVENLRMSADVLASAEKLTDVDTASESEQQDAEGGSL